MNRARYLVAGWLFVVVSLSPSVPGVQADDHQLHRGDRGRAVVALQTSLSSYGYTVTVDGRFGPQTERAVRHWQKANGLDVDGIAGPATLATFPATRLNPPTMSPQQIIRDVWPDDVEDRALGDRLPRITVRADGAKRVLLWPVSNPLRSAPRLDG